LYYYWDDKSRGSQNSPELSEQKTNEGKGTGRNYRGYLMIGFLFFGDFETNWVEVE